MQTTLKFFDIAPVQGSRNMPALNKVALKLTGKDGYLSEEAAAGFMQMLSTLMALTPEQVQQSLEGLDWVPVDGASKENLVPLIDLTDSQGQRACLLNSLFRMTLSGMVEADTGSVAQVLEQADQTSPSADSVTPGQSQDMSQDPWAVFSAIPLEGRQADLGGPLAGTAGDRSADKLSPDLQPNQPEDGLINPFETADKQAHMLNDAGSATTKTTVGPEQVPEFVRQSALSRTPQIDSGIQMDTAADPKAEKAEPVSQGVHASQNFKADDMLDANQDAVIKDPLVNKNEGSAPQVHTRPLSTQVENCEALPRDQQDASLARDMSSDVIRQIVQKMTLRSHGQQSRMQIRLKPEFLGDIRMQIITQNQHVMVRMTADSQSVKEIIEQNMHQLKTDLQQHGLHIDKFEVLVGQDDSGWKNNSHHSAYQQARQDRRMSQPDRSQAERNNGPDSVTMDAAQKKRAQQYTEIDYFA